MFHCMAGALVFEITKDRVLPGISIWGPHLLAILFLILPAFIISVVISRRREKSRAVLESPLREVSHLPPLLEQSRDDEWITDVITERKRSELELLRLNRALTTLSKCNEALVHASDEAQLLNQICEIVVQDGGYRLAWVGHAEQDEGKTVRLMAKSGFDDGYIEKAQITWADMERGCGPAGTAIKTGEVCILRDIHQNPQFSPWRDDAVQRGYASVISLPVREGSQAIGVVNIYATEPDAFDDREVELLKGLASNLAYGIASLRNAAERARAEEAVRRSEEQLRSFVEMSPFGIFRCCIEADSFLSVNPAFVRMFGYASAEEMLAISLSECYPAEEDRQKALEPFLSAGWFCGREVQRRRKDGRIITVHLSGRFVQNTRTGGRVFEGIAVDVTDRKRAEQALEDVLREQSTRDALTGLYNRRYLEETLGRELILAERHGYSVSVIMADFDHFKAINERYGHLGGDEVLRVFGDLMRRHARGSDIYCRYGGEEFLLVLPQMAKDHAVERAGQLCRAMAASPVPYGDSAIAVSASFGVATFPCDGRSGDALIDAADGALYEAKAAGRNRVHASSGRAVPKM